MRWKDKQYEQEIVKKVCQNMIKCERNEESRRIKEWRRWLEKGRQIN